MPASWKYGKFSLGKVAIKFDSLFHIKKCFYLDRGRGWGMLQRPINFLDQKSLYHMLPHIDEINYKMIQPVLPLANKLVSL